MEPHMSTKSPALQATIAIPVSSLLVDEHAAAEALGLSVHTLRKDRRASRQIPFYRIGGSIRYNLTRVLEALAPFEEGGARPQPRKPRARAAA